MRGIDIDKHYPDIENIYLRHFARWMRAARLDEQDGLQAVLLAIHVRNDGKCPWDPKKGSLGHYVYRIAHQQISSLVKKATGARAVEVLGGLGYLDAPGEEGSGDVAEEGVDLVTPELWALARERVASRGTVPS